MSDSAVQVLDLGSRTLEFRLRRSVRRRTLEISVAPDRQVTVIAPTSTSIERISTAVRRRADWILRQQRTYEALPPPAPARQWVAGETHKYLGRQYRLRLSESKQPSVKLTGAYFEVSVPQPRDGRLVQGAMERWYRQHAVNLLSNRVTSLLAATTWLRTVPVPQVTIRAMRLRWGSATQRGRVYFNTDLVKLPLGCIDYIVMHELVHLRIPHHGPAFWRLLSRCLPDWERWKDRLAKQEI